MVFTTINHFIHWSADKAELLTVLTAKQQEMLRGNPSQRHLIHFSAMKAKSSPPLQILCFLNPTVEGNIAAFLVFCPLHRARLMCRWHGWLPQGCKEPALKQEDGAIIFNTRASLAYYFCPFFDASCLDFMVMNAPSQLAVYCLCLCI